MSIFFILICMSAKGYRRTWQHPLTLKPENKT